METEEILNCASDLLNLMNMDPEGIWSELSNEERSTVRAALQHFGDRAAAARIEQDVVEIASALLRMVHDNETLRGLLISPVYSYTLGTISSSSHNPVSIEQPHILEYTTQMHISLTRFLQRLPGDPTIDAPPPKP